MKMYHETRISLNFPKLSKHIRKSRTSWLCEKQTLCVLSLFSTELFAVKGFHFLNVFGLPTF